MNTEFADDLRRVHAEFDLLRQKITALFQGQAEAGSVLPAIEQAQTALAGVLPENTNVEPTDMLPGEGRSSNLHPSPPPPEELAFAAPPPTAFPLPTPAPDQSTGDTPAPAPDQSTGDTPAPAPTSEPVAPEPTYP